MRNNVSYAEITCDICGKIERIPQSLILPKGWSRVEFDHSKKDTCDDCLKEIEELFNNLRYKRKRRCEE